jgi:hypothetical protein
MVLIVTLAVAAVPAAASAGSRMFVGFQDDPSFRWEPDRLRTLDHAQEANATVLRTTVYWYRLAPERPTVASNPFDPAYRFEDLDDFVRGAQQRGMEVLLTIWGTPGWANGGKGRNRLPTRLSDLTGFTRALASRYSGLYAGYPHVRFYSVWNEPNLELFLKPQFDARGRSVGPALYARLYRAAHAGLKAGNPSSLVAIGETSARGRDRRTTVRGVQQTHSPGRFAELLSKQRPRLRFDAWAHHPYPSTSAMKPTQKVRWPNVSLTSLPRFELALDKWFGRKNIPIWLTEYGHETSGAGRVGVPRSTQAAYAAQALTLAAKDPRVDMFIWFILEDNVTTPWQSGLIEENGTKKPSFARFAAIARGLDARNPIVQVTARGPLVRVSALSMAFYSDRGARVGITYRIFERGRLIEVAQPEVALGRDGWFSFRTHFMPLPGRSYVVRIEAGDIHGNGVVRTVTLVRPKPPAPTRPAPSPRTAYQR